jgi:hypothetical protein
MRRFLVVGPEYGVMDIIVDGRGPIEYERDYVEVEAANKRDAKVLAVGLLRNIDGGYLQRYRDENPFAGLSVAEVEEEQWIT